jgi:hypothetical protein
MIQIIGTDDLDEKWPEALKLLEPALTGASPRAVRAFIEAGTYQLWMAGNEAAATTSISTFPVGNVLTVVHLGGRNMWQWLGEGLAAIEFWAREKGCDRIRINGRDEWSRVLPGYRKTAVVSEKVLT